MTSFTDQLAFVTAALGNMGGKGKYKTPWFYLFTAPFRSRFRLNGELDAAKTKRLSNAQRL